MNRETLQDMLSHIDPSRLDYSEWTAVGMALKHEGFTANDWETWSARDSARYHPGECYRKWDSFQEAAGAIVTGGTLYQMARDNGWTPDEGHELSWDDEVIGKDEHKIIDTRWLEGRELTEPGDKWDPVADLIKYIETLFQMDEFVGTVTGVYQNEDGKYFPQKGDYSQTAGEILKKLKKSRDIGAVIGDPNTEAGAWIRFNPLDGQGCKNENVTDFRFALVESDTMEIEKQNAILRELELPIACLVHSGKKSLHAIVRIDAGSYEEYRSRVDFLYNICKKNGLQIDTQNRNPSRLSRMPGVVRNGRKQYLIDTNIGKKDWQEWREWIEAVNDDLPDAESLETFWDDLPPLADPLIDGVLRQGHKLLLAGPSKAGKSFALIELCIAIAEGKQWLGWQCAQGRVLYVNLELDRASCLHRFKDVYQALGWRPSHVQNIDIWNLRGSSIPMDKLAPKLIRRANKKNYIAVIIDPIYKVITGDENSADQMAHFCNQFDKVCASLGCAVIYCHHHSKGAQGDKRAIDRASGSGVFARDPDALLDLIELEITPAIENRLKFQAEGQVIVDWLDQNRKGWREEYNITDTSDGAQMKNFLFETISTFEIEEARLPEKMAQAWKNAKSTEMTAWRIEGTLREFKGFKPLNLWFDYPIHRLDFGGALRTAEAEGKKSWQQLQEQRTKKQNQEKLEALEMAFSSLEMFDPLSEVTVQALSEEMQLGPKAVKNWVSKHPDFEVINEKDEKGRQKRSIVRRKVSH